MTDRALSHMPPDILVQTGHRLRQGCDSLVSGSGHFLLVDLE